MVSLHFSELHQSVYTVHARQASVAGWIHRPSCTSWFAHITCHIAIDKRITTINIDITITGIVTAVVDENVIAAILITHNRDATSTIAYFSNRVWCGGTREWGVCGGVEEERGVMTKYRVGGLVASCLPAGALWKDRVVARWDVFPALTSWTTTFTLANSRFHRARMRYYATTIIISSSSRIRSSSISFTYHTGRGRSSNNIYVFIRYRWMRWV